MFVIGIGSNLNKDELKAVASDPDDEHLFYYGFNDLSAFVDQMSTTSCDGKFINMFLSHIVFKSFIYFSLALPGMVLDQAQVPNARLKLCIERGLSSTQKL